MDDRLKLAYEIYPICNVAADIGTDHAFLPTALLKSGKCRRMILCDISDKALAHARETIERNELQNCTELHCCDGLKAIHEPCDCISITGMGGENIRQIILEGRDRIGTASLILSAHTEKPLVRQTIMEIGYHIAREELIYSAGRYYIVWLAEPGKADYSADEIALGTELLFNNGSPVLGDWIEWQIRVLKTKLSGLMKATSPDTLLINEVQHQINILEARRKA